jgi:hypothetical protein
MVAPPRPLDELGARPAMIGMTVRAVVAELRVIAGVRRDLLRPPLMLA